MRWPHRTLLYAQWLLGSNVGTKQWALESSRGRVLEIGRADRRIEGVLSPDCQYAGLDNPTAGGGLYGVCSHVFGDSARLQFPDACFYMVTMLEVLEHLRQSHHALSEIVLVVSTNGQVLPSMSFLYPTHDAPHGYQRCTVHGLQREIEPSGLKLSKMETSLGCSASAGLIASLALGDMAVETIQRRHSSVVPIPLINMLVWLAGLLMPSWSALGASYRIGELRQ